MALVVDVGDDIASVQFRVSKSAGHCQIKALGH
jgi:hypothetical protein